MTTKWVPFTLSWDDHLPVDISFVFEHEKPAGKHGFLTVQGDRFVFEDGTDGRFWGTNFNSGANFPPHEYSEMVARRLAKFGVNIMRTHQMDSEWATPNIFTRNRAMPKDNTRSLDTDCMDRLDYLFSCLKQEGVYVYLDLLTYRQFLPGDAVKAYEGLPQAEIRCQQPYRGFLRIALSQECAVKVRIPEFTSAAEMRVYVNGAETQNAMRPRSLDLPLHQGDRILEPARVFGNYLELGQFLVGDHIEVSYPLPTTTEDIAVGNPGFKQWRYRVTWKGDTVVRMEPLENDVKTTYSDFDKTDREIYYGTDGPGPLYQREQMLQNVQPSEAELHLDDGALDLWKI
jgi:hypothetical protein